MDSTLPTGNQTEPYAGISEFELPSRTRNLATRIADELLAPVHKRLDQARQKLDSVKSGQETKVRNAESHINSLDAELRQLRATAETHLSKERLSIPNSSFAVIPRTIHGSYLVACKELVPKICKRKWPAFYFRSNDGKVAWGKNIVVLFLLIIPAALAFWKVALGVLAVVFAIRQFWVKSVKNDYSILLEMIRRLSAQFKENLAAERKEAEEAIKSAEKQLNDESRRIEADFSAIAEALHKDVAKLWEQGVYAAADWTDESLWNKWTPDPSPEFAARIGVLEICPQKCHEFLPKLDFRFRLPALVPFAEGRCLLLNATAAPKNAAANALLSVMIRVLANTPPGKARFTFIDPVGLGQNVADFLHLGEVSKELISGKAWSEPQHIEQQLAALTEHMETVIQTRLRKDYASIVDYNRVNHEVAQAFRFLVVNDFPVNFTESSARRLVSIVKNGPRCGVFTFILRDTQKSLPYGFNLRDLEEAATQITFKGEKIAGQEAYSGYFIWEERAFESFDLFLDDKLPPQDSIKKIIEQSGQRAREGMKLEVPFQKLLASASIDSNSRTKNSTAEELKVPLGLAGGHGIQELALGGEQEAHALLVGRTGSGKTNLMHVLITALALKYPAKEVALYLIDFKGGVGFKRYAECKLPHADVIAIESEREYGISVLQKLDAELTGRSNLFKAANVGSLSAYRATVKSQKPDTELMPRIFLIIDEFQEFFTEQDDLAQRAKIIFERLARQGRSYGIHFLLSTQSLTGSGQLPPSIMGQIKVRIALPCNESDSRLILADDNKAARALSQPGEGIYNPLAGLVEGNNPFQCARFYDNEAAKYLAAISEADRDRRPQTIFEGNELAKLEQCVPLSDLLNATSWPQTNKSVELLLGDPIAILPPVAARLRRQSGSHLMILTREEVEGVGMCLSALVNILAQQHPEKRRIYIADFATADAEWAGHSEVIANCFPGEITLVKRQREIAAMFATIVKEIESRSDDVSGKPSIYLVLQGMHRIKALRDDTEDEAGHNAVELLKTILRDGPEAGVHVLAWADTWGNITRGLDRKTIGEFGSRVAGVMDSGDSMNFLDNLAASKIVKSYRAIFYDEDRPGQLTAFRPYTMPPLAWLQEAGSRLRKRFEKPNT